MEIVKEPVVAWVFVRTRAGRGDILTFRAAVLRRDGTIDLGGLGRLEENDQVAGVVPASPGTAEVWGRLDKDGEFEHLGYEVPGVPNQSWGSALLEKAKVKGQ